jgi:ketosteroid isomerase-like protein
VVAIISYFRKMLASIGNQKPSAWFASEAPRRSTVNDTQNMTIMQTYIDSLSKGDMEAVGDLLADDVAWHQPGNSHLSGLHTGKQELFAHLGQFMELSGNTFRVSEVKSVMANDDMVTATLHFMAERPGRKLSMDGVDTMRIADGKIKEVWLFSGDQAAEDAFWS